MIDYSKYNNLYIDYHRIEDSLYRERVRFYEDHRSYLEYLSSDQKTEIDLNYIHCLFEIGKYERFLKVVDRLIEKVITDNIYEYNGKDIYRELLFRKAASLYNTDQVAPAMSIAKQLLRMHPDDATRHLYARCRKNVDKDRFNGIKAIAVVSLLSGLSVSVTLLFIIEPFYSDYSAALVFLRDVLFATGVVLMVGHEIYMHVIIARETGISPWSFLPFNSIDKDHKNPVS